MPLSRFLLVWVSLPVFSLAWATEPGGPTLQVTGVCPGPLDISIQGATPGGSVTIAFAQSEGSATIPGGPCAGTSLDLQNPQVLTTVTADASGDFQATFTVPALRARRTQCSIHSLLECVR